MPQCHDANVSANQVLLQHYVSRDIRVHSDIRLQFLISYFRGTTFRTWLRQANSFSYILHSKLLHGWVEHFRCLYHPWYIRQLGWIASYKYKYKSLHLPSIYLTVDIDDFLLFIITTTYCCSLYILIWLYYFNMNRQHLYLRLSSRSWMTLRVVKMKIEYQRGSIGHSKPLSFIHL